ncbi:MAG: methyltransferase domain-containing protein [Candidatus Kapabacteria bacterium]|nr:methyltransferase domain-containing protein [Candidatus Kapabacteria bacterium]
MKSDFDFYEILCCPKCNAEFELQTNALLCKSCKMNFELIDEIPLLLLKNNNQEESGMNYIKHYTIDANEFDYFEDRADRATEDDERRVRQYIISKINKNSKLFLDVGCGNAWLAEGLIPKGKVVISSDISLINLQKARKKVLSPNHLQVAMDGLNPPFKQNTFDCIIASEILEHIVNPDKFINGLMKILKPGGQLIISTPYKEKIQYSLCIHCNHITPKNAHLHSIDESFFNKITDNSIIKRKYFSFGNKLLNIMRTYWFTRFLPLPFWLIFDGFFNLLINKKAHIISIYIKK